MQRSVGGRMQPPAACAASCLISASVPSTASTQPPEHSRFTNPSSLAQPGAILRGEVNQSVAFGQRNVILSGYA